MAIITIAAPLTGIRGRYGSSVYSAGTSGPFVRQYRRMPNRLSAPQSIHRRRFSPWAEQWNALSQGDRDLWIAWAADVAQARTNSLGQTYYMSGYQAFVCLNTQLATCSNVSVSIPPTSAAPLKPDALVVNLYWPESAPLSSNVQVNGANFPAGNFIVIFVSAPRSPGVLLPTHHWKLAYADPLGIVNPFDFTVPLDLSIGDRRADQIVFFDLYRQRSDGDRSRESVITSALVVAQ